MAIAPPAITNRTARPRSESLEASSCSWPRPAQRPKAENCLNIFGAEVYVRRPGYRRASSRSGNWARLVCTWVSRAAKKATLRDLNALANRSGRCYSNANAGRAGVRVVLALGGFRPLASTLLVRPRGGSVPARSPDLFRVGAVPVRLDRLASEARSGPACGTSVSLEDTDPLRRGRTCGRSVRALAYHGADSL